MMTGALNEVTASEVGVVPVDTNLEGLNVPHNLNELNFLNICKLNRAVKTGP